eukprot:1161871-Pelagomonas_calceolata.AAC.6
MLVSTFQRMDLPLVEEISQSLQRKFCLAVILLNFNPPNDQRRSKVSDATLCRTGLLRHQDEVRLARSKEVKSITLSSCGHQASTCHPVTHHVILSFCHPVVILSLTTSSCRSAILWSSCHSPRHLVVLPSCGHHVTHHVILSFSHPVVILSFFLLSCHHAILWLQSVILPSIPSS